MLEALAELHLDVTPLQVAHVAQAAQIDPAAKHVDFDEFQALLGELEAP